MIDCGFSKNVSNSKSGFWIRYKQHGESLWKNHPKVLYILFDRQFLNLTDAHFKVNDRIPQDVYLIEEEGPDRVKGELLVGKTKARKLTVSQDDFWLQIHIQSRQDGGAPFVITELQKLLDSSLTSSACCERAEVH